MKNKFDALVQDIKKCQTCVSFLPNPPKPIVSVSLKCKILIIGQAPGNKVHQSGISFDDKSGENLRDWLGITKEQFYDTSLFGVVPMGFCFPGSNPKGGDLPPRKECAPQWHVPLFEKMKDVKLILLVGAYTQKYYLGKSMKRNLTETVKYSYEYLPKYFPLVHPSPLNFRWQAKNPWFKTDVLPNLKNEVHKIITN